MDKLWKKARSIENVVSYGEKVKRFRYLPGNKKVFSKAEAYQRADWLRKEIEQYHPGKYAISVAVRDKHVGGWRSGKFTKTSDKDIYIWSPEEYDKEFNNVSAYPDGKFPDLEAEMIDVFVRRIAK